MEEYLVGTLYVASLASLMHMWMGLGGELEVPCALLGVVLHLSRNKTMPLVHP